LILIGLPVSLARLVFPQQQRSGGDGIIESRAMAGHGSFSAVTTGEIDRLLAEPYAVPPYMAMEMPVAFCADMDKGYGTAPIPLSTPAQESPPRCAT